VGASTPQQNDNGDISRTRRLKRTLGLAVALAAVGVIAAPAAQAAGDHYPWAKRVRAAERYADGRQGIVSFAVVGEDKKLRGDHVDRQHNSHSVVKAMLLGAYLRQADVRHRDLTDADRDLLGPMIRRSDNRTASAVYERVGPGALYALADDARMKRFSTQGVWGLSQITARDQARFFHRLDKVLPDRHRDFAMRLLTQIVKGQRWGIPPVAPRGWILHFKGGWAPTSSDGGGWGINQVMLLRDAPRRFAVAILTRYNPSKRYGIRTLRGVARRLLRGYGRFDG
jgi:beta-lactamase family protein